MKPNDARKKKRRRIKFIGIFIVSIALLWLLNLIFRGNDAPVLNVTTQDTTEVQENIIASQQRELLKKDRVLHEQLNELQKLDEAYTSLLTDTANKAGLIEMNARITSAEEAFRESIDSVAKKLISHPNREDETLFVDMIASFRLAFENRRSVNNLRNAIGNNNAVLSTDQKLMLKGKNELLAKNTRIAFLENELKMMQNNIDNSAALAANSVKEGKDKIASLTAMNNTLQKENDRLSKQFSEAGKNMDSKENSFKNKNASLESKIDELNAELRLAQVDCNLSRVDASQIISNSKQRRLLLSEALTILNSLSKSENVYTKRKIQDKIAQLNQVAMNYRD